MRAWRGFIPYHLECFLLDLVLYGIAYQLDNVADVSAMDPAHGNDLPIEVKLLTIDHELAWLVTSTNPLERERLGDVAVSSLKRDVKILDRLC